MPSNIISLYEKPKLNLDELKTNTRILVAIFKKSLRLFDYWLGSYVSVDQIPFLIGRRVVVSFGKKTVMGFVVGLSKDPTPCPLENILPIQQFLDEVPVFSPLQLKFILWFSDWWFVPIEKALNRGVPSFLVKRNNLGARSVIIRLNANYEMERLSLNKTHKERENLFFVPQIDARPTNKSSAVREVVCGVWEVRKKHYKERWQQCKKKKCSLLILFPDLQTLYGRLHSFQEEGAMLFCGEMKDNDRAKVWLSVLKKKSALVLGLACALWLPFQEAIEVVIDQEESEAYRDKKSPGVHVRDILLCCHQAVDSLFPHIVFGSETPSLEVLYAIEIKKVFPLIPFDRICRSRSRIICISRSHLDIKGCFSKISAKRMAWWLFSKRNVLIIAPKFRSEKKLYCLHCREFKSCPRCQDVCVEDLFSGSSNCLSCGFSSKFSNACSACGKPWFCFETGVDLLASKLLTYFSSDQIVVLSSKSFFKPPDHNFGHIYICTSQEARGIEKIAPGAIFFLGTDAALCSAFSHVELRLVQFCFGLLQKLKADLPFEFIFLTEYPHHALFDSLRDRNYFQAASYLLKQRKEHQALPYVCWVGFFINSSSKRNSCDHFQKLKELKSHLESYKQNKSEINVLGPFNKRLDRRIAVQASGIVWGAVDAGAIRDCLKEVLRWVKKNWADKKLRFTIEWDPKM